MEKKDNNFCFIENVCYNLLLKLSTVQKINQFQNSDFNWKTDTLKIKVLPFQVASRNTVLCFVIFVKITSKFIVLLISKRFKHLF